MSDDILIHRLYQHHSGRFYRPFLITNGASDRPHKFPKTVVYRGSDDLVWSRPVSEFRQKMTLVSPSIGATCVGDRMIYEGKLAYLKRAYTNSQTQLSQRVDVAVHTIMQRCTIAAEAGRDNVKINLTSVLPDGDSENVQRVVLALSNAGFSSRQSSLQRGTPYLVVSGWAE